MPSKLVELRNKLAAKQQHMAEAGFTMPPTLHDAMLLDRLWFNPKRCRRLDESTVAVLGIERTDRVGLHV